MEGPLSVSSVSGSDSVELLDEVEGVPEDVPEGVMPVPTGVLALM